MWSKGHSFFMYRSDNVDSLASCCFAPNTKVLAKSSNGVHFVPIQQLHETKWLDKKNLTVFHNGSWVRAKTIKLPLNSQMYRITTANKKIIDVTDNHLWPTMSGQLKRTDELTVDDYLMFNVLPLDAVPERDRHLTYNQGLLIGMYLGDGSIEIQHDKYETVHYSLNEDKYRTNIESMNYSLADCGIDAKFTLREPYNNVYPVSIYGHELADFIREYVTGSYANEKHLNGEVFCQSKEFRQGILDGMYATDGGNNNRIYTTSSKLASDLEALCSTLGLATCVDISDRTDEPVIIRGKTYDRNYPLFCVRYYEPKNKSAMGDIFRVMNNSMFFKIRSIEKIEDVSYQYVYCFECYDQTEPYFTLPGGLITHNCRLRNEVQDNQFSYTLGAGGVSTGSKCVMTINVNKIIQEYFNNRNISREQLMNSSIEELHEDIVHVIGEQVERVHNYLKAFNTILEDRRKAGLLPLYDSGFVSPLRQYLTIGINSLVESAEYIGCKIKPNDSRYEEYVNIILKTINELNKKDRTVDCMFNTEYVPAENLGVKNAKWATKEGLFSPRKCFNSYFYLVEDPTTTIIDKFVLHGKKFTQYLDGGSALHCNLDEHLTKAQYRKLMDIAIQTGCPYFTFNVPNTVCKDCGHISKMRLKACPKCGSENLDYATRVIGYLKLVSSFSEPRQQEEHERYYANLPEESVGKPDA